MRKNRIQLFTPVVTDEAVQAANEVMRSGWIGMGPKTAEFEKEFAQYVGAKECVMVNTCTSALHLAVKCLDLAPGAEVITTPITFVSTNHVLLYEGLKPIFADIQPDTGNLDPQSIESHITENTAAIMLVHYAGYPCDLDEIYHIADKHGLKVIEDSAHACGASYRGAKIGSRGGFQAFSFDPIKNLTTGDGGALTTSSEDCGGRLRQLRYMGVSKDAHQRLNEHASKASYSWEYSVAEVGFRYHMNDIAAAMGLAHLKILDVHNARRQEIADRYRSALEGVPGVTLLKRENDRECSNHLMCILCESRNNLADKLTAAGVVVGMYYARNDDYPMYESSRLPGVAQFCEKSLCLPMHVRLTDEEIEYVCDQVKGGW